MGKAIFIAGTDTGVGKTSVSMFLMNYLEMVGYSNLFLKPIETGVKGNKSTDFSFVYRNLPFSYDTGSKPADVAAAIYHSFSNPCSPHLASLLEGGMDIDLADVGRKISAVVDNYENVIIEGAGGVCVPVNSKHQTFLDVVKKLKMSTILVSSGELGAINSTHLAIQGLHHHGVDVLGFMFNDIKNMAGLCGKHCTCKNDVSVVDVSGFATGEILLSVGSKLFSFDDLKEPICPSCLEKIIFVDNSKTIEKITKVPFLGFVPYMPQIKVSSKAMDHEYARDMFALWVNVEKILYSESIV